MWEMSRSHSIHLLTASHQDQGIAFVGASAQHACDGHSKNFHSQWPTCLLLSNLTPEPTMTV